MGGLQEPLDRCCQRGVGDSPDHRLLPLPVLENQDGGDASDAVPYSHFLVLVSVELEAPQPAGICFRHVCDDRVHHTARAAPWCPELDEHWRLAAKDEVIPGRLCYIQHCKKEEWLAMSSLSHHSSQTICVECKLNS